MAYDLFNDLPSYATTRQRQLDEEVQTRMENFQLTPDQVARRTSAAAREKFEASVNAHNFWTKPNQFYDPKLQFRFTVEIPGLALEDARGQDPGDSFADTKDQSGDVIWYVKSCDKPGYTVIDKAEGQESTHGNKSDPEILTSPTFKKVTMTLIDPIYPNVTRKLARILRRSGFKEQKAYDIANSRGGPSQSYIDTIEYVKINQLDANGAVVETWTLVGAYVAEVDWGRLDYSSEDLVEISVTWGYKTFTVEFPAIGNEQPYKYFRDVDLVIEEPTEKSPCTDPEYAANNPGKCKG